LITPIIILKLVLSNISHLCLLTKSDFFLVRMWLAMPEAIKDVVCDAWGPETDDADD